MGITHYVDFFLIGERVLSRTLSPPIDGPARHTCPHHPSWRPTAVQHPPSNSPNPTGVSQPLPDPWQLPYVRRQRGGYAALCCTMCMCVRVFTYTHACASTCAVHACAYVCVHAYMRTCVHAYMCTCVHAYTRTRVHAYMRTCVHACAILGAR